MRLRGSDLALAVGAVVVAGVCLRLGVWQLDRLAERQARNAVVRAARERPPLDVAGAGIAPESAAGRRVVARGVYDYARERVWRGRTHEGIPGVHLLTPLKLADGSAVVVDRGWVPSPDAARVDLASWRGADSAVVEGFGVRLPRGRGDADPRTLGDSLPYALLGFGVQLGPPPALGNGPHLSYAVQWFSFAAIALVGTFALLSRLRRGALPSGRPRGDI